MHSALRSLAPTLAALTGVWLVLVLELRHLNALSLLSLELVLLGTLMAGVLLPALVLGGVVAGARCKHERAGLEAALAVLAALDLYFVAMILVNHGIYFHDWGVGWWGALGLWLGRWLLLLGAVTAVTILGAWLGRRTERHGLLAGGLGGLSALAWLILYGLYYGGHPGERLAGLISGGPDRAPVVQAPVTTPVQPTRRLVLLGVDGMSGAVVDRLVAEGELPHVARIQEQGWWGPLRTDKPTYSPILWTSMATGRRPARHGVLGTAELHLPGASQALWAPPGRGFNNLLRLVDRPTGLLGMTPPLGSTRRARALWEMVDLHGGSSYTLGWWPSRPVDPVRGGMVSDFGTRALGARLQQGEALCPLPQVDVQPASLCEELAALSLPDAPKGVDWQDTGHRPTSAQEALPALGFESRVVWSAGLHLYQTRRPDLLALYVHDLDTHWHWEHYEPELWGREAGTQHDIRHKYYAVDALLGAFLEALDEHTALMVVSDHSLSPVFGETRPRKTASHSNAPPGVMGLYGAGVSGVRPVSEPSIYEVAPLALQLMGLPAGADMPGVRPGQGTIPTYGGRSPQQAVGGNDPDFMRQLEALGYLE